MKKTKIVCTIGPASGKPEVFEAMIKAGMNVARLNFSHGTHEEHGATIQMIRSVAARLNQPIAILQDIAGPKIRCGTIAAGTVELKTGQTFVLTDQPAPGDSQRVSVSYSGLPRLVRKGDRVLLSDGALELEVQSATDTDIICKVINGGTLSSRKGINLPSRSTGIPILTEKDRADLLFGLEQDVDYIGLSFVRTAEEIQEVRDIIQAQGKDTPLIAKIEKPEAVANIDAILQAADGIMVARGDLGVEVPYEQVPLIQRTLIEKANRAGKPVITATQMMESMVNSPRPTRAEVTDVANAILLGTDAIMLSEESAMGQFPVQAVAAMQRVAAETEKAFPYRDWTRRVGSDGELTVEESVARAADGLLEDINAAALVTFTSSGSAARRVAKYRPPCLIIAPTPNLTTYRRLALVWGAVPLLLKQMDNEMEAISEASALSIAAGLVEVGQKVVVTAGVPMNRPGHTNVIWVVTVGEDEKTF